MMKMTTSLTDFRAEEVHFGASLKNVPKYGPYNVLKSANLPRAHPEL